MLCKRTLIAGVCADSSDVRDKLVNVSVIVAAKSSFAALRKDGTVVFWGIAAYKSSDCNRFDSKLTGHHPGLHAPFDSRCAGKNIWTKYCAGVDCCEYSKNLQEGLVNITKIFSTEKAFAALRHDGTVLTWGHPDCAQNCTSFQCLIAHMCVH